MIVIIVSGFEFITLFLIADLVIIFRLQFRIKRFKILTLLVLV